MKKIIPIMFVILSLFLIGVVFAIPQIPHAFEGNVYYFDGTTLIADGYIITAIIGDFEISVDIINGTYDLMVESDGGTIEFYISGQTEAIGNYPFASSHITELDFTTDIQNPNPEPDCGDGTCDTNETCSSCPADCGCSSGYYCSGGSCIKSTTHDDDDGNGGGGGGGSSTTVATSKDGLIVITAVDGIQDDEGNETIDLISDESQETTGPGITGGVIGFMKSGVGIGLIFTVLVLIVGIGVVTFRKQKKSKSSKEKPL